MPPSAAYFIRFGGCGERWLHAEHIGFFCFVKGGWEAVGRGSLTLTALPSHTITIRKSGHKQNIPNLDERFKMIVSRRARLPITSLEID